MMLHYQEPNATIYSGHAIEELKALPAGSVDMCITSPPYWGLRTYKTEPQIWDSKDGCKHEWGKLPDKYSRWAKELATDCKQATESGTLAVVPQGDFCSLCGAWRGELGLEPTIELYISHLILIFNEVKRVLKKTGTCWVNLDDSYAGSGKGIGSEPDPKWAGARCDENKQKTDWEAMSMPAKSLCLIPQRFAIAMVEQGWILRNDIVWNKPNPMPESVKDRFTGSWEHLYFFVKSKKYWFEQQLEQIAYPEPRWGKNPKYDEQQGGLSAYNGAEHLGRNKRDVWEITTQGYPEAHFATFPEKLCETPILAGCPDAICKKCGKAREKVYEYEGSNYGERKRLGVGGPYNLKPELLNEAARVGSFGSSAIDKGYTDCGCNAGFESGVVLDPFCGSGTTLAVAKRLNRKGIGIDINPDYCKLTTKRLQEIPIPMDLRV